MNNLERKIVEVYQRKSLYLIENPCEDYMLYRFRQQIFCSLKVASMIFSTVISRLVLGNYLLIMFCYVFIVFSWLVHAMQSE